MRLGEFMVSIYGRKYNVMVKYIEIVPVNVNLLFIVLSQALNELQTNTEQKEPRLFGDIIPA